MKLLRYGPVGKEKPGLLDSEGKIRDLSAVIPDINGETIGPKGQVWGPITKRIADAYIRYVGCDFVQQYLDRIDEKVAARAF